ncbi:DUF4197 domain-containing protein [Segetibacter aerophilus]|uniref:DUF4197 domain-containing protein n=1 Tax=Segetibacter aerophilus TaxID=670293 RepID=A0A512BFV5_9BACT|nr:DUF4197 domain-containing protein [Segetibacter aerophilus]GEO10833.1 hypothetical protein SAE01_33290 [Segetibacter aerophilus]
MKKFILFTSFSFISIISINAQGLKGLINKISKDTSRSSLGKVINSVGGYSGDSLSTNTIASGLKEALQVGTERGTSKLSAVDGFFKNAALKILMPAEAVKVESKLRALGLGKQVDNAILSMNRAAEDASKSAAPIFINAIKQMTIQDAVGILKGGDFAATNYLKSKTTANLTEAFRPVIEQSLAKVNATKYWNTLFTTYNTFSTQKVNTDLSAYVTEKALSGIFQEVSLEEQKIRKDPAAQTTALLKKVFGK